MKIQRLNKLGPLTLVTVAFGFCSLATLPAYAEVSEAPEVGINSSDQECKDLVGKHDNEIAYRGENHTSYLTADTEFSQKQVGLLATGKIRIPLVGDREETIVPGDERETFVKVCNTSSESANFNVEYENAVIIGPENSDRENKFKGLLINKRSAEHILNNDSRIVKEFKLNSGESATVPVTWSFDWEAENLNRSVDGRTRIGYNLIIKAQGSGEGDSSNDNGSNDDGNGNNDNSGNDDGNGSGSNDGDGSGKTPEPSPGPTPSLNGNNGAGDGSLGNNSGSGSGVTYNDSHPNKLAKTGVSLLTYTALSSLAVACGIALMYSRFSKRQN